MKFRTLLIFLSAIALGVNSEYLIHRYFRRFNITGSLRSKLKAIMQDEISSPRPLSPECLDQLHTLIANTGDIDADNQMESFQFFDSWGKLPSGITNGHLEDFGNYEQCLQISTTMPLELSEDIGQFDGKYCHLLVPVDDITKLLNMRKYPKIVEGEHFDIGICIPKVCDETQLNELIFTRLNNFNTKIKDCSTVKMYHLGTLDYVAM